MIGQYLSNTNENATVSISQNFSELNTACVIENWNSIPLLLRDLCVWRYIYVVKTVLALVHVSDQPLCIHVLTSVSFG
jgi:hypothetical protein